MVGGVGWDVLVPGPIAAAAVALPLGALLLAREPGEPELSGRTRLVLVVQAVLGLVGVALLAFVLWNPVAGQGIAGLQGRYWLPFLPVLVAALAGLGSRPSNRRARGAAPAWAAAGCGLVLQLVTLGVLLDRYWFGGPPA